MARGKKTGGGSRKGVPNRANQDVRALAQEYTVDAVKTLAQVMLNSKAQPAARVIAANALLDRGYGKPTQHIEANVSIFDKLSLDEQRALSAALSTLAGDAEGFSEGVEPTHH
ncbi:MAG: hypothetical protein WAN65_21040 [Candidatus Sulfotelmatobacter sp.]